MDKMNRIKDKILTKESMIYIINGWRLKNNIIIFTNGCFDIIHRGHIHLLSHARDFGDKLIVGLNSDESIKKLKGESRPFNNVDDRSIVLAAMSVVDAVVIFNEETPFELIKSLSPDVLVKGGDYKEDNIVGGEFVIQNGGKVEIVDYIEGYSSSGSGLKIGS